MVQSIDWLQVFDLASALQNVQRDMYGDWYQDPWGWPELAWVCDPNNAAHFRAECSRPAPHAWAKVDVPKEYFGTRPAVILNPADRLIYQASVDRMSKKLIGDLSPRVFGWRGDRQDPQPGKYESNTVEWRKYLAELTSSAADYHAVLETDITGCFASMPVQRLCERIGQLYGRSAPSRKVSEYLSAWDSIAGRRGLPQRALASSVVANMYLSSLDSTLAAHPNTHFVRWMDDIHVFGDDESLLRRIQVETAHEMRELGLEMNSSKTRVLTGAAMRERIKSFELGAANYALLRDGDTRPLQALIDQIDRQRESTPRTVVSFVVTRMIDFQRFGEVNKLRDVAARLPHCADHLGHLFRASGAWQDLGDWFVEYERSHWGVHRWSVARLAQMFPSNEAPPGVVSDLFEKLLSEGQRNLSLPLVAVATQRLSAWMPDRARELVRTAAADSADPSERRVFALASLLLGEEANRVRRILSVHAENQLTLAMLEDTNFRKPKVTVEFEGTASELDA